MKSFSCWLVVAAFITLASIFPTVRAHAPSQEKTSTEDDAMQVDSAQKILVIGRIAVREDALSLALALSREHVERSRREPGCISHNVHQDVYDPLRLVFVEEWADSEALAQHFAVPASGQFVRDMAALATEPPSLQIFEARELPVRALGGVAAPP